MKAVDGIKLFGFNNIGIEADLQRIEKELAVPIRHSSSKSNEQEHIYYPQFSERLRQESEAMSAHYSIFYCLENSIRELIRARLADAHGINWWSKDGVIPPNVLKNCEDNRRREMAAGITPRSDEMLDYSNFGELGDILRANWEFFGETFRDRKAVDRILASLNTLRAPIAHCKALAEDEVLRLHLALRDWFRQME